MCRVGGFSGTTRLQSSVYTLGLGSMLYLVSLWSALRRQIHKTEGTEGSGLSISDRPVAWPAACQGGQPSRSVKSLVGQAWGGCCQMETLARPGLAWDQVVVVAAVALTPSCNTWTLAWVDSVLRTKKHFVVAILCNTLYFQCAGSDINWSSLILSDKTH